MAAQLSVMTSRTVKLSPASVRRVSPAAKSVRALANLTFARR
jgi:hypothetical protein